MLLINNIIRNYSLLLSPITSSNRHCVVYNFDIIIVIVIIIIIIIVVIVITIIIIIIIINLKCTYA